MNRLFLTLIAAVFLVSACGLPPEKDDVIAVDAITPRDDSVPDDPGGDTGDPGEPRDIRDTADQDAPDPDGQYIDSADVEDLQVVDVPDPDDDAADPGDAPDVNGPCGHCDNGICDLETLDCLECNVDLNCGPGAWCDNHVCRDHLCSPGANFCAGSVLLKCSENGGGFTVIRECADTDPCTEGDGCFDGRCEEGVRRTCQDDNQCTVDYCGVGGICEYYAAEGIVCDDGNPCTRGDYCTGGDCVPAGATDCSDQNPCTLDYCISASGCVHEAVAGHCGDSNGCTTGDRCIEGRCSGDQLDCDDHDQCTSDFCSGGNCLHQRIAGCLPCRADADCEDGDDCTMDTCDTESGICHADVIRTGGCCLYMTDCPPVPQCRKPVCSDEHRCLEGALLQPACCTPEVITESFGEGIPDGWLVENGDETVGWRTGFIESPVPGIEPPAAYFGNPDETSYDNSMAVSGSLYTPAVTLPAGSAIRVSFRLWQDVEPLGGYDRLSLSVIADTQAGSVKSLVWDRPSSFPDMMAQTVSLDLSGYSGRTVRLEFRFDSIDAVSNSGRGIYIDDVIVEATCSQLPCLRDYHCKSSGINGFCRDHKCDFQTSWMEITSFGGPGSGAGTFLAPTDVVAMPGPEGVGNQILVTDSKTHYVQVFDADGAFMRMFGGYGITTGRFLTPRGLQDSEERVFITDSSGGRIQAMTAAGVFLYSFGSAGIDPGQFDAPRDVGVSPDGNMVYVADTGNHRISVFSRLGVYKFSFGAWGRTEGRFRTPSALAVAPDGKIWVCDTQNNRLQVFYPDGLLAMVVAPDGDFALNNPSGVAVMKDGRVVVADTYNHRLLILDSKGLPQDVLGTFGDGAGQFNYPSDVDVMWTGSDERLVVADAGNFRITVWAVQLW